MFVDAPSRMSGNTPQKSMSNASTHTVGSAEVERRNAERWHALVSEIGAEIASPLTAALERIHALVATGKIDRAGLRASALELLEHGEEDKRDHQPDRDLRKPLIVHRDSNSKRTERPENQGSSTHGICGRF